MGAGTERDEQRQLLSWRPRCDYRDEHVVLSANNMCATFIALSSVSRHVPASRV
jgi:hypothetical protein